MITIDSIDLDKVIEIWSIRLNGVGPLIIDAKGRDEQEVDQVWYEVHVTIQHSPGDGQRFISEIFPEYGEVTDEIRKVLETRVQEMDN